MEEREAVLELLLARPPPARNPDARSRMTGNYQTAGAETESACPWSDRQTLHVTNGDSAAALIRAGGSQGTIIAWRDVLHEGPVPAGLSLRALGARRAAHLAGRGWGALHELTASFRSRDRALASFQRFREVILWFEHDLYDQLQLAQVLDFLAGQDRTGVRISLICIDSFPGVESFRGLGNLTPDQMPVLLRSRREVEPAQYALGVEVWRAFRHPDPTPLARLLQSDLGPLPYMKAAIGRQLEELPSLENGLGRTEQQVLEALAGGISNPVALLKACWASEESPFMGDTSFWAVLGELAEEPHPLVRVSGSLDGAGIKTAQAEITSVGAAVMRGECDAVQLRGVDRWYGGTHLRGKQADWRWDARRARPVDTAQSAGAAH